MSITLRNILAFFLALSLIISGRMSRACQRAMNGDFILSIYFHNPSKREFESVVKWLMKKKFRFLSVGELQEIITNEVTLPKGAVVITVDDGWRNNEINIAEIANKYQIPITIFISTEPVEKGVYWWSYAKEAIKRGQNIASIKDLKILSNRDRLHVITQAKEKLSLDREAMTIEQIRRISKSDFITIGGHTHSHPILTNCSDEDVREELRFSKIKLSSWIGKEIDFFAYPNGDFSHREIEILKELDYKLAFTNNAQYLTRDRLDKKYSIPRFGFLEGASFAENKCRLIGIWNGGNLKKKIWN
jgi:peptidoglycan/xylan/chitin deacetylase (PgdA/CDA1 family)